MKTLPAASLLLTLLLSLPQLSLAVLPGGSGGGDVVVMPNQGDDSIRLADPWLISDAPIKREDCKEQFNLPTAVVNELGRVAFLFSEYDSFIHSNSHKFVDGKILDSNIHYCLVDQLPKRKACEQRMSYGNLPQGAKVVPAACTEGSYTWVVRSLVKNLSVREQARLYVHEGLRRTNTPEDTIAGVTDGLDILLKQYNDDINGNSNPLKQDQLDQVLEFRKSLALAGLTSLDPRDISQTDLEAINANIKMNRGGGIIANDAKVADSAYVGVGIFVGSAIAVGANAKLVNSNISGGVTVGENTSVIDSTLTVCYSAGRNLVIGDESVITNSTIELGCAPYVNERIPGKSEMYNRTWGRYKHKDTNIGSGVTVKSSKVKYDYLDFSSTIENHAKIIHSKITNTSMKEGASIKNSELFQDLGSFEFDIGNSAQIFLDKKASLYDVYLNKGGSHSHGSILIGEETKLSSIGLTRVSMEMSAAIPIGGLVLGMATMGLGAIALGYATPDLGKMIFQNGIEIEGNDRPLCGKEAHVSYGSNLAGDKISSLRDLKDLCTADAN